MSFQKFSGGDTPEPLQHEGATASCTQHPAPPLVGNGVQAPRCWDPNLGLPQLFSCGCALAYVESMRTKNVCKIY